MTLRVLAVGAAMLVAVSVRATVLIPADLGDLSREAVAIVRGQVVAVEGRWTDGRRRIETIVTLEAEAHLKGQLGATVHFRVPGGRLGRYRTILIGAPEFAEGQRVVVFLGGPGPSLPHVIGLGQGVYRVRTDAGGWVVTPPAVLPTAGPSERPERVVRGDPDRRPMPLSDFEQRVRELAGGLP